MGLGLRVFAASRSLPLTVAAVRTGTTSHLNELARVGSITRGEVTFGGTRVHLRGADVPAAWHILHTTPKGWTVQDTDDGFLVTVRPQGLEFEVPRGLLPDALGSLIERFLLEEYAALDVDGAVVVDIGAYIGDSAIYLQRSGARMVFSYEPFPVLADVARRNVARNGLDAVISIACAGVGSPAGTRRASFRPKSSMMSDTVTGAGRDRVSIRAFGDVLDAARAQLKGGRLVCKIDCEGAEREFFGPGLLPESFDAVDELALEWHDEDPSPVIDDLRRRGFSIRAEPTSERVGAPTMIFARRRRTPA